VFQTALTVALTAVLILVGYGMPGLAVATGVPPLLGGLAAAIRVFAIHRDTTTVWYRPHRAGCRHLLREGFGAWIGGFGTRLQVASSGVVLALLGRPDWATVYAATGKVAHVAQSVSVAIPDSGLVGLSQLRGEGARTRTHQIVMCLLLLYFLIPGVVAIGILAANAWFVNLWLGQGFYAGDYISAMIAINLVLRSGIGGLYKIVGVAGYRTTVGLFSIGGGVVVTGLGYWLGSVRGLAGLPEAVLVMIFMVTPPALYLANRVYGVRPKEYLLECVLPWACRVVPVFLLAILLSDSLRDALAVAVVLIVLLLCAAYFVFLRPLLTRFPWPLQIRSVLQRVRLVDRRPEAASEVWRSTGPT
jgi:O-antigen/teichoic acid export membrane protein